MTKAPTVSIGLPVYNGENFVAEAIESVLAQTYQDLELVITDNASTDRTQEICATYAAQDPRIKYHRNERNLGAAPNFNLAFELCTGRYFKWMAHDDLIAPTFLEKCVAVLERDPGVVLCFSGVQIIDDQGQAVEQFAVKLATDAASPSVRLRSLLLDWHVCFDVFGLIRTSALRAIPLMGSYSHGDGVLLTRLSLLGRFHQLPEDLFLSRRHRQQSMLVFRKEMSGPPMDYRAYAVWFDSANRGKRVFPMWRLVAEYYKTLWLIPLPWPARARCHGHWAHWVVRHRARLVQELFGSLRPPGRAASAAT